MADSKPVVKVIQNINDIIKLWALKGKRNQEKYTVEIIKNELEFIQVGDIEYKPVKKMVPSQANPEELVVVPDARGGDCEAPIPQRITRTVHTTSFSNNTSALEQKHHFKVERTSKTNYSWSMTSGHTFSAKAGITLEPPKIGLNISTEFSATKEESTNEVYATEKTRTSTIEADVVAPKGKRVNVNLNVTEEDYIARYEVQYRIQGEVYVIVRKGDEMEDRMGQAQDVFRGWDGFDVTAKTPQQTGYASFVNRGIFMSKRETKQELEMYDEDL